MASKDHKSSLKTVKKWEKEFKCDLEVLFSYLLTAGRVDNTKNKVHPHAVLING